MNRSAWIQKQEKLKNQKQERKKRERNHRKRGWSLLFLALACTLALTGCRLAREEEPMTQGRDRLCGVLVITQEQKDAYLQNHSTEGRERSEPGEQTEDIWLDGEDVCYLEAQPEQEGAYRFPGMEDAPVMMILEQEDEEGDYCYFTSDGAIQDISCNSSSTDAGENSHMEGTVYLEQGRQVILYVNQVYQRPDGSVYVILNGSPGFQNRGQVSLGEVFSQSYKEEYNQNFQGKEEATGIEFTVHIAVGERTLEAVIKEWSKEDVLLRKTPLARGQEEFFLLQDTAYVTVEEETENGLLKRSIYTWEDREGEEKDLSHAVSYGSTFGLLEMETISFLKP